MNIFEDRERAFPAPWAREAEHRLRIRARRNRLLAEWAVRQAGLVGDEAAARARALMKEDYAPEGETAFLAAVTGMAGGDAAAVARMAAAFEARAAGDVLP